MTVIDEEEAQRVFEVLLGLDQLDELQEDSMELPARAAIDGTIGDRPPSTKDGS